MKMWDAKNVSIPDGGGGRGGVGRGDGEFFHLKSRVKQAILDRHED